MTRNRTIPVVTVAALAAVFSSALGSWDPNGTPICTESGAQYETVITTDGAGGAILAWTDARGSNGDIYAQRIDGWGNPQWTPGGAWVGGTSYSEYQPIIVSDGAGGAIIVWLSHGTRAQRVDPDGNLLWDSTGVVVDTVTSLSASVVASSDAALQVAYEFRAVTDGAGGAIIFYERYFTGEWWAQRLDGSGNLLWPGGTPVRTLGSAAFNPAIAADGAGGAIMAWEDARIDIQSDIFAQRVDAAGTPLWTPNGVAVATAANYQENVVLTSDGAGGAILSWRDLRVNSQTYAQRIDASGTPVWTTNGELIMDGPGGGAGGIVADGVGGAVIVCNRYYPEANLFAQRVNTDGDTLWSGAAPICVATGGQFAPAAVPDGEGGLFIAWEDWRTGGRDIFAQRMDTTGAVWWNPDGESVCTAIGWQLTPAMVSIGGGKVILAWDDRRTGSDTSNYDVYAQRMTGIVTGVTGRPPRSSALAILPNTPNPFNSATDLVVNLPAASSVHVEIYDVLGRRVRVLKHAATSAGLQHIAFDGRDAARKPLASGVYFYRVIAAGSVATSKMIVQR
ncbi:MAG: T9SS type A sorting domain-containing protein [Candidatus Krumholzibacteria bacterium]|nr:T9SS type A sorting domain-containing protein [Candidatus Krumholzibacteria bacterium]